MQVKITSSYTREEVLEILASLVKCGLLTSQEQVEAKALSEGQSFRFFDLNYLLLPFVEKFAGYSKDERSLARLTHASDTFYRELTLRLLQGCPLRQHPSTCTIDSKSGELTIQVGHLSNRFNFRTHPEYETQVINCLNHFLGQYGVDAAYHQIEYEDYTAFPLLSAQQYEYVFTNRLLEFARVEYPEVEAWREAVKDDDLPF